MTIAELDALIEKARSIKMTEADMTEQRLSFAYGNTHIENSRISKEMITQAESTLENTRGQSS